jgi:hypothetical protein
LKTKQKKPTTPPTKTKYTLLSWHHNVNVKREIHGRDLKLATTRQRDSIVLLIFSDETSRQSEIITYNTMKANKCWKAYRASSPSKIRIII